MWTAMAMVLLTTTLTIATAGAYATNGGLKMGDPEIELADYIAKCRAMHESHVAPTPMFAHAVAALADKLEEAEQSRDINHAAAKMALDQRDALAAKLAKAERELRVIAAADPRKWESDVRDQFQQWAQNRARAAIDAMKEQP